MVKRVVLCYQAEWNKALGICETKETMNNKIKKIFNKRLSAQTTREETKSESILHEFRPENPCETKPKTKMENKRQY